MGQILLVLKDKELSTILRGKLSQKYGVEVIAKGSAAEAISLLEILPDIDIVLCHDVIERVQVATKLCDYLTAKKEEDPREVNVVVLGKSTPNYPKIVCIGEAPHYDKIVEYLGFVLGKEEKNIFIEDEKAEKARAEKEKADREKAEKERVEAAILAKANAEKEKIERAERANARIEKVEMEKALAEKEKAEKDKAIKERIERGNARLEKVEKEKAEKEKGIAKPEKEKEKEKENDNDNEKTTVFRLPILNKTTEPATTTATAVAPPRELKVNTSEYLPMNVIYFMNLPEMNIEFSVYTRIKKAGDFEYNKKFSANTKITPAEIERVLLRSGKDLYIANSESATANAFLNGVFLERFKKPDLSWVDRIKLNSDGFEILLDLFKHSTFNKYNVEIIKELIKSIDLAVNAPDAKTIFLTSLNVKKLSYGYTHSHFTLYLLFNIADHFPWSKDQSKNKLLYLSLFHDLNLTSDRLIKLHHNYFQESKNLTEEEKQIMLEHADASAAVLESLVKAPKEMTSLIREHHGFKSGKGFAEALSIAISPTSMAFIVIEDFVTQYLLTIDKMEGDKAAGPNKSLLEPIFAELKKKYSKLTYGDVLDQLQKFINT